MLLTIGLEIHVKLKSINKMFCQCKNEQNFETLEPNTNICPVCTGQPGALPTLSQDVLEKALILGKAMHCKIQEVSKFDRKSYFYPDLPMGYQITQLYEPTCVQGQLNFFLDNYTAQKTVHIHDAHMECDTAKMIHQGGEALLDFNRAGTPLVEIVTNPDFSSVDEVVEFLKEIQRLMRYNEISDADMEKGQMRCDVNISLRADANAPLGIRTETKNINSFGMVKRAIEFEEERQLKIYESGGQIAQETRGRDDAKGESFSLRSKEDALDYRYFPEPDLPELQLDAKTMERLNDREKEIVIPYDIIKTMKEDYGFNKEYINALISDKEVLDYFLAITRTFPLYLKRGDHEVVGDFPKLIAKWIVGPIAAWMKENLKAISALPFSPDQFSAFLTKAQEGSLMENQLKIIMESMLSTGKPVEDIIKEKGFDVAVIDESALENIVKEVLAENPKIVEEYKNGKLTVIGFLVGQVMKKTGGKVNPKTAGDKILLYLSTQ